MHFLPQDIDDYTLAHSEQEPDILFELQRETWQKILNPRMVSGAYQGRVLSMLSKLMRPHYILEIGTYTGYSALCLAEGLAPGGKLITLDVNEEIQWLAQKYFDKSDFKDQIESKIGNALALIPELDQGIDLVFIDADKENYQAYFDLVVPMMNKGGVILSDNVLWSGKVVEQLDPKDKSTKALLDYNRKIAEDPRVETVLLPIRDGLTLSRTVS
ncbi:O-methyltransferase [Flavobacteriaceae bacterium]|nr:O-methyltransferase [Flavobacteriaceae bacterium]